MVWGSGYWCVDMAKPIAGFESNRKFIANTEKKIQARWPSNLKELNFSNEELDKIPLKCCQNLIQTYSNRLKAVIAAKGGPIKYDVFFQASK